VLDLTGGVRGRVDSVLESAVWAGIAAAAIASGAVFLLVALFVAVAESYDALTACLVLGVLFVVTAAVATVARALARRRARPVRRVSGLLATGGEEAAAALHDASVAVSQGVKRAVRRRPLAALGLMLVAGFMFGVTRR
jgi:hypothetical protein